MKRRIQRAFCWVLLTTCLTTLLLPAKFAAADHTVTVSLPEFPVTLNGMEMDNQFTQYPLLVYNNITYFPMTYYGSRYLGVETTWNQQGGLGVHQNGVRWNWHDYKRYLPNKNTGVAAINTGTIYVNNQLIDNSKEDYPLLSFRDVTYFPLTWRFAVDEFGWTYQYSPQEGLAIHSPGAVTANEITLPIKEYANGVGSFVKAGEYYYYEGERGTIWQAPVAAPAEAKKVYQLPVNKQIKEDGERYCRPELRLENGAVLLRYEQTERGKTTQCYVRLFEDGTTSELYRGSGSIHCYDNMTVLHAWDSNMETGSIQIQQGQQTNVFHNVTKIDCYTVRDVIEYTDTELLFIGGIGDNRNNTVRNANIVAVNYKTGAVRQVVADTVRYFAVEGDNLYYLNEQMQLYRMPLAGGKAVKLTNTAIKDFVVLHDTICYADAETGGLYVLGSHEQLNPGGMVDAIEVQEDFFVINFSDEGTSAYKTMILSRKGKVLFKTTEHTASMIIENGKVSFVKLRS